MIYSFQTTNDFDKEIKRLNKKYPSLKTDLQKIINNIDCRFLSLFFYRRKAININTFPQFFLTDVKKFCFFGKFQISGILFNT